MILEMLLYCLGTNSRPEVLHENNYITSTMPNNLEVDALS